MESLLQKFEEVEELYPAEKYFPSSANVEVLSQITFLRQWCRIYKCLTVYDQKVKDWITGEFDFFFFFLIFLFEQIL